MRIIHLILIFFLNNISYSQTWEYEQYKDNYIKIRDKWGEEKKYSLEVRVSNKENNFIAVILGTDDNWINIDFPNNFVLISGDSLNIDNQEYNLEISYRGNILKDTNIYYSSFFSGLFQLKPIDVSDKILLSDKQEIIDSYYWEDSLGNNYIIRTRDNFIKHIYFYHYILNNNKYILINKHSDKVIEGSISHIINNICITDVNKDNIAEITYFYKLNEFYKMLFTSNKEKYLLRQNKNPFDRLEVRLINKQEIFRFMNKKWNEFIKNE